MGGVLASVTWSVNIIIQGIGRVTEKRIADKACCKMLFLNEVSNN